MQVQGKISYLPHLSAWCFLFYGRGKSLSQANRIWLPWNGGTRYRQNVPSQKIGMFRRVCFPFARVYTTPAGSHTHTYREAAGGPTVDTPERRSYIWTFGHLDVWTPGHLDIWTFGLSLEPYPLITAEITAVISSAVTSMLFDISSQRGTEPASPGIRTVFFNQGRRRGQRHSKPKAKEWATAQHPHIPMLAWPSSN